MENGLMGSMKEINWKRGRRYYWSNQLHEIVVSVTNTNQFQNVTHHWMAWLSFWMFTGAIIPQQVDSFAISYVSRRFCLVFSNFSQMLLSSVTALQILRYHQTIVNPLHSHRDSRRKADKKNSRIMSNLSRIYVD